MFLHLRLISPIYSVYKLRHAVFTKILCQCHYM